MVGVIEVLMSMVEVSLCCFAFFVLTLPAPRIEAEDRPAAASCALALDLHDEAFSASVLGVFGADAGPASTGLLLPAPAPGAAWMP